MHEKNNKYKLSIITVNLNNKQGLIETIDSVINQSIKDFEWIIIDGGSTDGSLEIIKNNQQYLNYWISEPDKGVYNAFNKGILQANGEYLYFLNSGDTLFNKETLKIIIENLKGNPIYISNCKINNFITNYYECSHQEIISKLLKNGIVHQSIIYHKNIFLKYGLYREDLKILSDRFLNIQSLIIGNESYGFIPDIIVNFKKGGLSYNNDLRNEDIQKLITENPNLYEIFNFYSNYYCIFKNIKNKKFFKILFSIINKFI